MILNSKCSSRQRLCAIVISAPTWKFHLWIKFEILNAIVISQHMCICSFRSSKTIEDFSHIDFPRKWPLFHIRYLSDFTAQNFEVCLLFLLPLSALWLSGMKSSHFRPLKVYLKLNLFRRCNFWNNHSEINEKFTLFRIFLENAHVMAKGFQDFLLNSETETYNLPQKYCIYYK